MCGIGNCDGLQRIHAAVEPLYRFQHGGMGVHRVLVMHLEKHTEFFPQSGRLKSAHDDVPARKDERTATGKPLKNCYWPNRRAV
jgi:hypothetical protein